MCGEQLLGKCVEQPEFFILLTVSTDEEGFTQDDVFNIHNTHMWTVQ
jgi:hypothetical protein